MKKIKTLKIKSGVKAGGVEPSPFREIIQPPILPPVRPPSTPVTIGG